MIRSLLHPRRVIDRRYLRWAKQQPCYALRCWTMLTKEEQPCEGPMDPHHAKEKGQGKIGSKPDDGDSIPACRKHHDLAERNANRFREVFAELKQILQAEYRLLFPKIQREPRKKAPGLKSITVQCSACQCIEKIPAGKVSKFGAALQYRCTRTNAICSVRLAG